MPSLALLVELKLIEALVAPPLLVGVLRVHTAPIPTTTTRHLTTRRQLSGAPYFVHFADSHSKVVVVVRADDTWNLEVFSAEDICREA